MSNPPDISEAEWKVMKVLWAGSPRTASEVVAVLSETEPWHPNTIKTLLQRLQKKGAVSVEKEKNLLVYAPLVSEEVCVQAETKSFLDRVFDGSVKPLLVHFAEKEKLSQADLEELRRILEKNK